VNTCGSDEYSFACSELNELAEEQELERAKEEDAGSVEQKVPAAPANKLGGRTTSEENFDKLEKHKICRSTMLAEQSLCATRQNLEKRS